MIAFILPAQPTACPGLRRGVWTAFGATVGMASGFGCLVLAAVFMVPLESAFGWTRSEIASGYAFATVGMAAGGVLWGRVSDRVDVRWLLGLGGTFIVLPILIFAAMTDLWQFYAASLLLGFGGFGCLYPPLLAAAGEWFDSRRGLVIGIVTAGGAIGQGVLPYLAEGLIAPFGWRGALLIVAALVFICQLIVFASVRRPRDPKPAAGRTENDRARLGFFGSPRLWGIAAAAFLCCACMGMPLIHLVGYVGAVCGSSASGATSLLVAMMAGAVGRICFGTIADRIGNLPSYAAASFIQSVCLLLFPWLQSEASLMALSAIFGFGFAGNMTCLILCIRDEAGPSAFGAALGRVMFIAWAGMGVGGYLGGAIFDLTGSYDLAFFVAAAFGAANLGILAALALASGRCAGADAPCRQLQRDGNESGAISPALRPA